MNLSFREAFLYLGLLGSSWILQQTTAQRVQPCFAAPPSCKSDLTGYELALFFINNMNSIVQTCFRLADDFFLLKYTDEFQREHNITSFEMTRDWVALADIPADSKFCAAAQRFMPYCEFCGINPILWLCLGSAPM